ncbi:sigma-70 family RNA polymerase sigma factor [Nannocystis bainbridge]|uniref:Sigma-70 family RNA polymerase sigma factor n=1 Tax=Nannocystis bainbridge TaxID=2995303 RepID=A0ABT5ECR1_9BACT|nr:sigma-70 family RNA polymerase sigma factor [Nannocystis bainbridge]MDC0723651.1 sigma-70 family RNA polymerase sigma factor [Nannocystis bainbridge]
MTHSVATAALADMKWLQRLAAALARDADDAADLVQDTLVAAWSHPPADEHQPLRPWLATVLRNRFRMQLRTQARRDRREQSGASTGATTTEPDRELLRIELLRVLLHELEQLAPEDRKILVRRFFQGESAAEIAHGLALPAATVRSRLHRSLQRLRARLDEQFGGRSAWCALVLPAPPGASIRHAGHSGTMSIPVKFILGTGLGIVGVAGWLALTGPSPAPPSAGSTASQPVLQPPVEGRASTAIEPRRAARAAISGFVRDREGGPVPAATVCAASSSEALGASERRARPCTIAAADGSYRLDGLLAAPHRVTASAPHFIPQAHRSGTGARARELVLLRSGQEEHGIDITLLPGGVQLVGIVRDLGGGEVDGAILEAGDAAGYSGADGRFSLWVPPGEVLVTATAEGYADRQASGRAPGLTLEILMTPESVLLGRVVRADDGSPVAGAEVSALDGGWGRKGPSFTDASGNFRIDALRPGAYKARALHDDGYGAGEALVVLGLGETSAPVEVRMHPAFLVEGTVVITGGGNCDRGSVILSDPHGQRHSPIAPDGRVRVPGLLPGSYEVDVRCEGFASAPSYPPLTIADRSLRELRWEVRPGQTIRGTVVTTTRGPFTAMTVTASPQADPSRANAQSTSGRAQADSAGRFEVTGLLPGRYSMRVYGGDPPQLLAGPEVEVREGHDLDDIRIELPAAGEVRGEVRDFHGRAIPGARVLLRGPTHAQTTSLDDGSFRLSGIAPGAYQASVNKSYQPLRMHGANDGEQPRVAVEAGETAVLDLVVEAPDGRISGRVVDGDAAALDDVFVEVLREPESGPPGAALRDMRWSMDRGLRPRMTDSEGRFEFGELPEGTYALVAHRRGGGEGVLERVALGSEVIVKIAAPGSLVGRVRLPGGGGPERFSVELRDVASGYQVRDSFFRTDGTFAFPQVPAGDFVVAVEAPEGAGKAEVTLATGQRAQVEVALAGRVTVRGRVLDLDTGAPVPGMRVKFGAEGREAFISSADHVDERSVTDAEGRFEVADVPVGQATVIVTARSFGATSDHETLWSRAQISSGSVVELAPLEVLRRRLQPDDEAGELGVTMLRDDPAAGAKAARPTVAFVQPGGPAARAGLRIGDVIVAVDGHDVTGDHVHRFDALTRVPAGTELRLELARGDSVTLIAARR